VTHATYGGGTVGCDCAVVDGNDGIDTSTVEDADARVADEGEVMRGRALA
jgi:hypothetical protein